jgi:DNA repair protein RadA/Sms
VYVNVAGGLRVGEPGLDLAVAVAVASARTGRSVAPDTAVIGELGLGGEVRSVPQLERRLAEAARLGFTRALAPRSAQATSALRVVPVGDLERALHHGYVDKVRVCT